MRGEPRLRRRHTLDTSLSARGAGRACREKRSTLAHCGKRVTRTSGRERDGAGRLHSARPWWCVGEVGRWPRDRPQTRYAPGPGVKLLYRSRRSASKRSSNPKEKATEVRSTSSTWRPRLDCTVYLRARRMGRGESAAGQRRAGAHSDGRRRTSTARASRRRASTSGGRARCTVSSLRRTASTCRSRRRPRSGGGRAPASRASTASPPRSHRSTGASAAGTEARRCTKTSTRC